MLEAKTVQLVGTKGRGIQNERRAIQKCHPLACGVLEHLIAQAADESDEYRVQEGDKNAVKTEIRRLISASV
jgi:hypothetical protein